MPLEHKNAGDVAHENIGYLHNAQAQQGSMIGRWLRLYLSVCYLIGANSMQNASSYVHATSNAMFPSTGTMQADGPTWAPLHTAVRHVSGFSKYLNTSDAIVDERCLYRLKVLNRDLVATNRRCRLCQCRWWRQFGSASPDCTSLWPRDTRTSRLRCCLEAAPYFDPNVSPQLNSLLSKSWIQSHSCLAFQGSTLR